MLHLDNNTALRNLSALVDFSNLINSSLELELILNNLLLTCLSKFHTTKGIVLLCDENAKLSIKSSKGISPGSLQSFPEFTIDEITGEKFGEFREKNNLSLCHPVEASGKLLGVICLGRKLVKEEYTPNDNEFLKTIVNVAASAIENSIIVQQLKNVNRDLDAKVNQLSSLFDLSKEFSSAIETERVGKLLVFSIIGQLMVTKFAVITCSASGYSILENRFPEEELLGSLGKCDKEFFVEPVIVKDNPVEFNSLAKMGVELIIPMKIKSETKGLILLGKKAAGFNYSKSDIEYIASVGSLAIISIENGRLFLETIEKQRLEKDLEIARNIQRNLLPHSIPKFKSFEIAALNHSAKQVGGDYYDIVKLDGTRTLIAIADVSGKGVQAALLMANLQAFLQSIAKQNIAISEASNLINDLVSENTTDGSFITFFWGVLDDDSKEFTYVNMGHNPPLHIRNKSISKLKLGGMLLGVMPTILPYKHETVQLQPDDIIVLFTDGITEAMSFDGIEYSDERLEKLASSGLATAEELLNNIINDVHKFTAGAQQSDDITAMVIKVI